MTPKATVLILYFYINMVSSSKILGVFPMPSASHAMLGRDLLVSWAAHGHQVTMLSPFPLENPPANYTDIVIDYETVRRLYDTYMITTSWIDTRGLNVNIACLKLTEAVLQDKNVKNFIKSRQEFDVVVYFQSPMDALLGFSDHFNASSIYFGSFGTTAFTAYLFNHPLPCTYMPFVLSDHGDEMTLMQRLSNCWKSLHAYLYIRYVNDPFHQNLLETHFPKARPLREIRAQAVLTLSNSHIATDPMRPIFQNLIDIGGFNMKTTEVLSEDVKQYLDHSKNGVILVSFGSNVRSHHMGEAMIHHFLEYFKLSSYDILWKLDVDLPDKSSNIKIQKWVPQKAVLDHPKVKIFITHGGRASFSEAIYYGVPVIAIPFFIDQLGIAERCASFGIGIKISRKDMTSQLLEQAVNEIINNPKYRTNIIQRSTLFRHQDMDPMEKAKYWIEHVIKNKNSTVLKSFVFNMPGYQVIGLDIYAYVILVIAGVLGLAYCLFKCMLKIIKYIHFRLYMPKQKMS